MIVPPPVAPPIGDTSVTHVMRLTAHSTTSPRPPSNAKLPKVIIIK
jgi:hypothetical protein